MDDNQEKMSQNLGFFGRLFREVWEFAKIVIVSLLVVLPIRFFIAQPFIVRGASMEPNFQNGEYLIIDEVSYHFREPVRGEVIVFRYPEDPSQFFIKRVIGLPGETVVIHNGSVQIRNADYPEGFDLAESAYLPDPNITAPDMAVTLNDHRYFVMGDNRRFSSDSRRWGTLEKDLFVGKAWLRLWPVPDAGIIQ